MISIDDDAVEEQYLQLASPSDSPEKMFERQWAATLLEQVVTRAMRVIDRLVGDNAGRTICVVGHGGVTRILVSGFLGVLPKLIRVPATNTNITIVTHTPDRGYMVDEMFNDAHVVAAGG